MVILFVNAVPPLPTVTVSAPSPVVIVAEVPVLAVAVIAAFESLKFTLRVAPVKSAALTVVTAVLSAESVTVKFLLPVMLTVVRSVTVFAARAAVRAAISVAPVAK